MRPDLLANSQRPGDNETMTTFPAPSPVQASSDDRGLMTSLRAGAPRRWVDFFLLLIMVVNLAWSMQAAKWSSGLDRLFPVALFAVISGTIIALSDFGRTFAFLYSLVVGAATVLFAMAGLAPAEIVRQERVYHALNRTFVWAQKAISGQPAADSLVFVVLLAILMWVLSYGSVWAYFRDHRKWQAVLPIGVAMLVNLYYAPANLSLYFVVYLLCAILLLVRATLVEREAEWHYGRVYFPSDISFDFMRDGILFAVFVIFVAWVLPTSAGSDKIGSLLDPLRDPWRQVQQEWTRLFSTLNYSRVGGTPTFGTSLSLGGPRTLNDDPVADVATPKDGYYRAVVLDTYLSNGWVLRDAPAIHLSEATTLAQWSGRTVYTQTVTTYETGNVLLSGPQPLQVDREVDARVLPYGTGTDDALGKSIPVELAMLVARDAVKQGDSYIVESSVPEVTIAELMADSVDYPDFITERYLQLPGTVPQRVFDLAEQVTAGLTNPYEKAKAVETYLRQIPYNDQIAGPQPGKDGVDYFLFEVQQGYCNYYASAMAVMLRHVGVPVRIASGYATGEYQAETGVYRLRNRDAHTWVEVYFPTYGWVQFEPTSSEPVIDRPAGTTSVAPAPIPTTPPLNDIERGNVDNPGVTPPTFNGQTFAATFTNPGALAGVALALLAGLGILAVVFWTLRRVINRPRQSTRPTFRTVPQGFSEHLWERVMRWARRFGLVERPSQTPLEHAATFGRLVPDANTDLATIANLYTRDLYSPHGITPDEAGDAQLAWLNARPLLLRTWLDRTVRLPAGLKRALFRGEDDKARG